MSAHVYAFGIPLISSVSNLLKRLHSKSIGIVLLVVSLALMGMLALFSWFNHQQLNKTTLEDVEVASRMIAQHYAVRKSQLSMLTERTSQFVQELAQQPADQADQILSSRVPQSAGEFVAIIDTGNQILAIASGEESSQHVEIRSIVAKLPLSSGAAMITMADHPWVINVSNIDYAQKSYAVIAGFNPQVSLVSLQTKLPKDISVSVLSSDAVTTSNTSIVLPLDAYRSLKLSAKLDFAKTSTSESLRSVLRGVGIQALAVLSLSLFMASYLFNTLFKAMINTPIRQLRVAIRHFIKGKFDSTVEIIDPPPFNYLSRDLEALRETIHERETKIYDHAEYDSLTGLANRVVISDKLKSTMIRAQQEGSVVTAVAIDLSRFSEINGSLGHEVGDVVLKEIARRLSSNARVTDTVARIGGDEFFIILEDPNAEVGTQLAKFMVSSLLSPISVNGTVIKLAVRSGVAFYPEHSDNPEALRRMASIALYASKETKSTFTIYEPGQDEKHLRDLAIIHDLPNAIKNQELYLQYQPKIDMETQQVNQVEALVRWRHPQLGFIPPEEFIALLEKAGLIGRLTDWVFKQAIQQVRDWAEDGFDLGVAVNISATDLADEKLAERVKLLIHHYLVDPASITIEVTESAVIEDPENSVKILNEFKKAGIKISLDDFGTGQTSLALLKQLPISEIKIDKSFVQNLRADSGDAIIVKSIIDLGHNMGLRVIAEGVESNYCWNLLNSYGCNLVQGYLISAPLTADELGEWQLRLQNRHVNKLDLSFVQDMVG